MIDFKDEILNGEARYRIRNANGDIVFDNVTLEQITETIQEPTPLNKACISNIQDNIQLNRLYNKITATKIHEQYNGKADDMFRSDIYPYKQVESPTGDFNKFGSYGYGNYVVYEQYRGSSGTDYDVNKIIDGNDTTGFKLSFSTSSTEPYNFYFKYPTPIKVNKVKIVSSSAFTNIYLSGSNNGTDFTLISDIASVGANGEISVNNNNYYTHYRVGVFQKGQYGTVSPNLFTIQFTEVYGNMEKFNLLTSELDVHEYEENMRILVEPSAITVDYPNYFRFKNLPEKLINGTIENGKKYELVYDGTVFNAREVV